MPHYVRILGEKDVPIPLREIRGQLQQEFPGYRVELEDGTEDAWTQILLADSAGDEIAVLERNPVREGLLGHEEIQEFLGEIRSEEPESAATWLADFLPSVRVIYAFQVLNGVEKNRGWDAFWVVGNAIWNEAAGIIQADGEGFSNRDGYHILWQFGEHVKGPWKMAVLDEHGNWIPFEMDLGNRGHRRAFLEGRIPKGAKLLK